MEHEAPSKKTAGRPAFPKIPVFARLFTIYIEKDKDILTFEYKTLQPGCPGNGAQASGESSAIDRFRMLPYNCLRLAPHGAAEVVGDGGNQCG
jgi:hypothetical protein